MLKWMMVLSCIGLFVLTSLGCEPGCEYEPGVYALDKCYGPVDCELKQNQCNLQLECGKKLKCNGIAVNRDTNLSCTLEDGTVLKGFLSQGSSITKLTLIMPSKDFCYATLTKKASGEKKADQ